MDHRWIARAVVAALHIGLLAALLMHDMPRPPSDGPRRLTSIRLIAAAPPRHPVPAVTPVPPPRGAARAQPPAPAAPDRPAADPGASQAPEPPPAPAATAAAPTEPARTTLRLLLPPGYAASSAAARNPALSDPRSNTARVTLEDRIADATGGAGAWVEEQTSDNRAQSVGALGDRRTVMRRGDTCVETFRSRIADADPFNGNVAPRTMAMQGKPYKCK